MSLYALQKLTYELNRDGAVQEAFTADREAVLAGTLPYLMLGLLQYG